MGLTVGLMFNLGKHAPPPQGAPPDAHAEFDSEATVNAIADAIAAAGHEVVLIEGDEAAYQRVAAVRPDIVFNICEGLRGSSREAHIPAILEMLGIPYTGSGILPLALSLDKAAAKKVFAFHGVPTPRFRNIEAGEPITAEGLRFPLFVKPAREGSSMGISPQSRVDDETAFRAQVDHIHRTYRQAALVEEFIDGREFTVGMVGNGALKIFPIMEIRFDQVPSDHGNIYSYQFKKEWDDWSYYACPAPIAPDLEARLKQTAAAAFGALGCLDVGRVDIRLSEDGVPYVLEINPLPGLTPDFSDLCRMAGREGWDYTRLVNAILNAAIERYGLPRGSKGKESRSA